LLTERDDGLALVLSPYRIRSIGMMLRTLRDWLFSQPPVRRRKPGAKPGSRPFRRLYCPSIDLLEDRRLLSVSPVDGVAATIASAATAPVEVVGRNIFYNNSRFDGNDPAASTADDSAIATDKSALLTGQLASFANYTSYTGGINGIMVDIAGLSSIPTAADFVFQIGTHSDPTSWTTAPAPSSITVRPGAGVGGASRVTLIWPDTVVRNEWLQVQVLSTPTTRLPQTDVFYFGNLIGDTGDGSDGFTFVDASDQFDVHRHPAGISAPVTVSSRYDFNRDGLVGLADEVVVTSNSVNELELIQPQENPLPALEGQYVFYNNSAYDGYDPGANSADDGAIAPDKTALRLGQTTTFANYTSYALGINGVIIDISNLNKLPTAGDFEFRVGSGDQLDSLDHWELAPLPSDISVRYGAGVAGSDRVTLVWQDGLITNQWLQITVKLVASPDLAEPAVFYFGNLIGDIGNDGPGFVYVDAHDEAAVRNSPPASEPSITSPLDFNRDQQVDALDQYIVRTNANELLMMIEPYVALAAPAAAKPLESVFADFVSADVVARQIFYNNSKFDGNNPFGSAADAGAIANDKSALLPGSSATFANYTSYSRGINGIMIDIAGLPGVPTADDFGFRVGTTAELSEWSTAPSPLRIIVHQGAGAQGAARITITWADNAIQNEWLQVTVKATPMTGLKRPDVFYFGNLMGDIGDSVDEYAFVDSSDQFQVRNNPVGVSVRAPVTSVLDFNRDSIVDSADEWIVVRQSQTELQLIVAPTESPVVKPERAPLELFHAGDGGYNVMYAPTLVRTNDGTILAIAEGRSIERNDGTSYALIMRRSTDGGVSWSPLTAIHSIAPNSNNYIGNPAPVVDSTTGEVFLLFTRNNSTIFVTSSKDNGQTWSNPVEITNSVKVTSNGNPNPEAFPSTPWGWYATGPGHGIQIQNGPYAGRLIIGCDHRITADNSGISWSHVIYSDDHGLTWHLGGGLEQDNVQDNYSNEASVVERSDGSLYMSIRVNGGAVIHGYSYSFDGGMHWTHMEMDARLTTSSVQDSVLRVNDHTILLSAPDTTGMRGRMTIWASYDDGDNWVKLKSVFFEYAGYSDMVLVGPDTVLLAYNRGRSDLNSAQSIGLARFNLRWLQSPEPYEFTWTFNEQAPGQSANLLGPSIRDSSPWDNRARAVAAAPADAPVYIAGPNGDSALRLTSGSDAVQLTPPSTSALQLGEFDSLTVQLTMRTTATDEVILGTLATVRNWTLRLSDGFLQFSVNDLTKNGVIVSPNRINDGKWHLITAVRDGGADLLRLYIDGFEVAPAVVDFTGNLASTESVTLGSYADGSGQLAFDVDALRITRAVLGPLQFLPAGLTLTQRLPPTVYPTNAPNSIANLKLWIPAYDPTRYFADLGFSDPLPLAPVEGTAARTAIDASPSQFQLTTGNARQVLTTSDGDVGFSWRHPANSTLTTRWIVKNSTGASPNNFDFVQNTGAFTLSTFMKMDSTIGGYSSLFDTANATTNNGFTFRVLADGSVNFSIYKADGTLRINATSSPGLVHPGTWFHVAVVGNGAGQPVTFYITSVNSSAVVNYVSAQAIVGANGNYPTPASNNLAIGGLTGGGGAFKGQLIDEAIYDRALTQAEIQQLFDFTKKKP